MRVWKQRFKGAFGDVQAFRIPKGSQILRAALAPDGHPSFWFTCNPEEKILTKRYFMVVITMEHEVPDESTPIGSWFEGGFVLHAFELPPECDAVQDYKAQLIELLKEETEGD